MVTSPISFSPREVEIYYAARVPGLKQRSAGEWRGPCPIHNGTHDNFGVQASTGLWHCHSQCGRGGDIFDLEAALHGGDFPTRKAEIFRLMGRTESDYRRNATPTNGNAAGSPSSGPTEPIGTAGRWTEVARYSYVNRNGSLLFDVVRYLKPDGRKVFIPIRPSGVEAAGTTDPERPGGVETGGIVMGLDAGKYLLDERLTRINGRQTWKRAEDDTDFCGEEYRFRRCPRVPYRLPAVLKSEWIYLPEGEKDVHTLEAWGLAASCNPGGADSSSLYTEWTDDFRDKHIVICYDNDEAGRKHAVAKAAALMDAAASVRIVDLPGLSEKGDVTDWRDAGGTFGQFLELVTGTKPTDAAALAELRARWGMKDDETRHQARADAADEWPELIPFSRHPCEPISRSCLPGWLGDMAAAVAENTETPLELAGLLSLSIGSSCFAGKIRIQTEPGYLEPLNLYVCVAMESGNRKTGTLTPLLKPLVDWESEEKLRLEPERARLQSERHTLELRIAKLQKEAANSNAPATFFAKIHELEADLPDVPSPPRLFVDDCTPEALAQRMEENGERMGVFSDEGGIFDILAGRYSRGVPNLDLFLKGHSGSPVRVDRANKERPPIMLNNPCLSVGISPQPVVLEGLAQNPIFRGRGLLARFLYALPESPLGYRSLVFRPISPEVEARYTSGLRWLISFRPETPLILELDEHAYREWKEFQLALEPQFRQGGLLEGMADWGGKLAGAAARFAGIRHVIEHTGGKICTPVGLTTMRPALDLAAALIPNARAVFSLMTSDPAVKKATKLVDWIVRSAKTSFDERECFRSHQRMFERMDALRPILSLLEQRCYIRLARQESTGGRPASTVIEVNPAVFRK
jgi:hypothetical protein